MNYVLQFTNKWEEKFFFQNLGMQWGPNDTRRLIELTTANREKARVFQTKEAASEILVVAGSPEGWEIIEEPS